MNKHSFLRLIVISFIIIFGISCNKSYQKDHQYNHADIDYPGKPATATESNSVCIRLKISDVSETVGTAKAVFAVTDPEGTIFSKTVMSHDGTCYAIFPYDFEDVEWKQGIYKWQGQIAGKLVSIGEFFYSNNGVTAINGGGGSMGGMGTILQGSETPSKSREELQLLQICLNMIATAQEWVRRPQILGGPVTQFDYTHLDFSILGKPVAAGTLCWTNSIGNSFNIHGRGVNTFSLIANGRTGVVIVYSGITASAVPTPTITR